MSRYLPLRCLRICSKKLPESRSPTQIATKLDKCLRNLRTVELSSIANDVRILRESATDMNLAVEELEMRLVTLRKLAIDVCIPRTVFAHYRTFEFLVLYVFIFKFFRFCLFYFGCKWYNYEQISVYCSTGYTVNLKNYTWHLNYSHERSTVLKVKLSQSVNQNCFIAGTTCYIISFISFPSSTYAI